MLKDIFFQGWEPLLRTAIGTTATYLALVLLLRFAGQRTLAKWYAFDLIVCSVQHSPRAYCRTTSP